MGDVNVPEPTVAPILVRLRKCMLLRKTRNCSRQAFWPKSDVVTVWSWLGFLPVQLTFLIVSLICLSEVSWCNCWTLREGSCRSGWCKCVQRIVADFASDFLPATMYWLQRGGLTSFVEAVLPLYLVNSAVFWKVNDEDLNELVTQSWKIYNRRLPEKRCGDSYTRKNRMVPGDQVEVVDKKTVDYSQWLVDTRELGSSLLSEHP